DGYTTLILCENSLSQKNLSEFFAEKGMPSLFVTGEETAFPQNTALLLTENTPGAELVFEGFSLSSRVVLLKDTSFLPSTKKTVRKDKSGLKKSAKQKILSYQDLSVGDYVVHTGHGIGIFRGVEKMRSADGSMKDFIKISYAGSDVLYVPCSNLDSVSKYIGPKSDSGSLKLNKLGGNEWHKAKTRAKAGAKDIAKNLIALYAERQKMKGFAFSPDTTWQGEFEESFPYGETDCQLRATREIKEDMERGVPMDRLLCGDVGFGKTEVALRGVFKCVMDSKQAAILVPTTILAWQHYQTLLNRFRGYPVRIEMLSRFRTKKEQSVILKKLSEGQIDILVGTHRLLQPDVKFSDLGFLVIDEEQRFGVTHKERLKEISKGIDVLTLTATPIPRTLNMALGGIKDMSLLEEAPEDRFPVQTYVLEYDRNLIAEAIRRELRRGGQVFYLHNNIEELQSIRPWLEREFPESSVSIAHGKMDKDSLSDIWKEMMDHKVDILLCTTIIETGVDLPDANTLIMENADHFGLSQLHQIRGRVGRSDRKAYAYLTYRKGKMLSEISVKRLEAIREYTEFGAGFQIALRDLEIRGAGNLLGAEQSGHLDSVGYDMFMKILNDAVLEDKGEKVEKRSECVVDLSLDGYIPEKYVPYPAERMDLYRKIASLQNESDAQDLTDEMLDRFGDLPRSVENLFQVSLLRSSAEEVFIEKIRQAGRKITFVFGEVPHEALLLLSAVYASRLTLSFAAPFSATLSLKEKETALSAAGDFCHHLKGFLKDIEEKDIQKGIKQ
ncbi:MAG: transcription-repair coupling factor, partial [Clostridia bacterium]|nr:transcription-repair coupling factor [Clostridia bacterium]